MTVKYTREHEWIRMDIDSATVGITFYAQEQLGDVVFVELPEVDTSAHIKFICSGGGTSTNGVPGTRPIARATSELQNLVSEKIQN